jgi:hypothetical protein
LSFFVGSWGGDMFYLGLAVQGGFKIALTLSSCVIPCIVALILCLKGFDKTTTNIITGFLAATITLGITIWWFTNWIQILTCGILDAFGYALFPDL